MIELPAKYQGLVLINPPKISDREYTNSRKLSEEGTFLIKKQQHIYRINQQKENIIKLNFKSDKSKEYGEQLNNIKHQMEEDQHNKERLKLIDANAEHTAYN